MIKKITAHFGVLFFYGRRNAPFFVLSMFLAAYY